MRGLAWTAILAALFLAAGAFTSVGAYVANDWMAMAQAGIWSLIGVGLAMLSLRE